MSNGPIHQLTKQREAVESSVYSAEALHCAHPLTLPAITHALASLGGARAAPEA